MANNRDWMDTIATYPSEKEKWEQERRKAWEEAFGLIKVDGLEPTPEFKVMIEKEIRGEITEEDLLAYIKKTYAVSGAGAV